MNSLNKLKYIVNHHDPVSLLDSGAPVDEYEEEIQSILAGLKNCTSLGQTHSLVYQIFKTSFGKISAGKKSLYQEMAKEIFDKFVKKIN